MKEKKNQNFFSPVNERKKECNLKEKKRQNILSNCINIYKYKKLNINKLK